MRDDVSDAVPRGAVAPGYAPPHPFARSFTRPRRPKESIAGCPSPLRHPDPAMARTIVAGASDPPALITALKALRHDLNGRVIVPASATQGDIDLRYGPRGARHHVRLEEVERGADIMWRRVGEQ